ncbi:MAG: hypothetical protein ACI9TV_001795 [Sulfurimonas sp.]|jgi:hypothetical protein|uniref:hypothetical protein n=1 Tax=Sulfurimonas sp. TaxID=2022749 RepID=UPI0039E621F3
MDYEKTENGLLKQARNAFETASTLHDNQRIEVYLNKGVIRSSDALEEEDEIVYTSERILCYQVYGHDYLEEEIKTWIDYARVQQQPEDGIPLPELTDIEKSIREIITELAKKNGINSADVSSYEVFANLPVNLVGTIEHEIIEYWWSAKEEENAKKLALSQIKEALENI